MKKRALPSQLIDSALRGAVREALGRLVPWPRLEAPREKYSIIVGTPWALRHILDVNLRCIARCDLPRLDRIHVVLDRPLKPGMEAFADNVRSRWRSLPIHVQWHAPISGLLAERTNVSTFFNGMNILTALSECRSRAMVLHDFDLYPLRRDYFELLASRILDDDLRFAGLERTSFDGLTEEDEIYGTWGLAMDAFWLRNEIRPADVLHRSHKLPDGRRTMLDPFSWLQLHEPRRDGVRGLSPEDVCHVKNLCSTYLRMSRGQRVRVAWRVHYLVYLEDVAEDTTKRMEDLTRKMLATRGCELTVHGQTVDFSGVDWTCSNVLERELNSMETMLFGEMRQVVADFITATRAFLRVPVESNGPSKAR